MNPRQRQQMGEVADLIAEGAEWWREAADALSATVPGLNEARTALRDPEASAALTEASFVELLTQVKRLAAQFDGLADRFAEAAAGLQSYRRCKPGGNGS